MTEQRYFVDRRVGCVAVRDNTKLSQVLFQGEEPVEEGPGLHPDMASVVKFWHGKLVPDEDRDPYRGHTGQVGTYWEVSDEDVGAAIELCDRLNGQVARQSPEV